MRFAVIAAGEGSRLAQEGVEQPKPLVPVCGEPMIERLLRIFVDCGATEIVVIVNEWSTAVREHLEQMKLPVPLRLVVKTTPSSMHSLHALSPYLRGERFCLTTVDTIFREEEFKKYIRHFQEAKDIDGCMAVTPYVDDEKPLWVGVEKQEDAEGASLLDKQGSLENMGEFINTPGDEMFPYSRTDSILYFASDGHPGFGGLDIFKATLTPSGGWKVENMGSPVNSAADDFGITFGQGESGFLTSNRGDGRGYDHIYSFVLPDLEIWISGWVLDRDEEPVPNAVIRIIGKDGSNQKAVANPDGSFRFPLQRGVDYVMLAGAKGYLNAKQEFTTDIAEEDAEYNVDFILASINKPVVIDNIFYDFDKAVLRDESKAALDEMAQIMRDNPNITIEMASHTDRVGSDEYNIGLSQRRAKSVIDYLISVGIKADRLQWQGYGKSRPKTITKKLARRYPQFKEGDVLTPEYIENLSEEDAEAADQINRRTEFQVLSIDYEMY